MLLSDIESNHFINFSNMINIPLPTKKAFIRRKLLILHYEIKYNC